MREIAKSIDKIAASLDRSVESLLADTSLSKRGGTSTFEGQAGHWRRVGGMNLFLREGDGVILNGPQALSGQPMSNITADDFKAIPHVKTIHARKGAKAVPGEDILEVASGTNKTTLTADHGKAVVTKGFGKVAVTLYAQVGSGHYEKVDTKSFAGKGKDEVTAFENAKAWARTRLRAKGRNRVAPKK
jgi:hypothetical protein